MGEWGRVSHTVTKWCCHTARVFIRGSNFTHRPIINKSFLRVMTLLIWRHTVALGTKTEESSTQTLCSERPDVITTTLCLQCMLAVQELQVKAAVLTDFHRSRLELGFFSPFSFPFSASDKDSHQPMVWCLTPRLQPTWCAKGSQLMTAKKYKLIFP